MKYWSFIQKTKEKAGLNKVENETSQKTINDAKKKRILPEGADIKRDTIRHRVYRKSLFVT